MLDTITFKELDDYIDVGMLRIVDLRVKKSFYISRIKGAINIPFTELTGNMDRFEKSELILFYCERGNSSLMACRDFNNMGYHTKAVMGLFSAYKGKYLES